MVLFELTGDRANDATPVLTQVEPMARQLEDELIRVKTQLRSATEQHELQAEELKASNEELQAINEELRSAAEELETSKEELQSINEELTTVNQELKVKVEESTLVSNNLQNLINSTDIATLFLDRSFQVNLFTPATRQIFNLIPSDFGRPLTDITNRLSYAHLQADAEAVLSSLQPIEREVSTTDGRVFIMRILPYRTAEDRINGVVLTFVDITERVRTEEALRESEEKYRTLFNSIDEAVTTLEIIFDENDNVVDWRMLETNPATTKMTGWTSETVGKKASEYIPGNIEAFWFETIERVVKTGEPIRVEHPVAGLNDNWYEMYLARVGGAGSRQIVVVYNNITERKRAEERQAFLLKLSDALRSVSDPEAIQATSTQTTMAHFGADRCYYGELEDDSVIVRRDASRPDLPSVVGTYPLSSMDLYKLVLEAGKPVVVQDVYTTNSLDEPLRQTCIQLQISSFITIPLMKEGRPVGMLSMTQRTPRAWTDLDIELAQEVAERIWSAVERAHAEHALRETEARLASLRPLTLLGQTEELAQIGSWDYDRSTGQFTWSDGMYRLFGLELGYPVQPDIYLERALHEDLNKAQRLVACLHEGTGKLEVDLRIRVDEAVKTLRIKAEVIGEADQGRVLGVDLDITEQLAAQQQIRDTAEYLQAVLDSSPAAIGLFKAVPDEQYPQDILDFELVVGNNKLARFFNQPLAELLGQTTKPFGAMLWEEETLDNLRQVYQTSALRYHERRMPAPHQDRWLGVTVTHQDDGVVLTGLDITELKQIQAQQQQWLGELEASRNSVEALAALKESVAQRTDLLRTFSHDLRGNFGIIQGGLGLLAMAITESDRARMMDMVVRNVKQATGLLTDLLELARLESGQQQRTITTFDISVLLVELVQSLQPVAQEKHLVLGTSGSDTLLVDNDRKLVYRLAQNLIINALKYTNQGQVLVHWEAVGDGWWFEVVDTGPGLGAELTAGLNRTEATPSAPSTEPTKETHWIQLPGEGIGLRIVRQLTGLLDAQLHVISELGVGSRFRIHFPRTYSDLSPTS
ncbi:PAS domain-containing protein [Spirosoma arboris]|uniref:PAS domain-containing protein n=1 Tax=Spirosoma arboris TaxID=2682092 RepID=UPI001D11F55F|nr:PAS domain-containing protein [Spirosoma arboris]